MARIKLTLADMRPLFRGILWFIGGLFLLLIMLQIFFSIFADEYTASYLKDQVRKSSHNAYTIDFDDLDLNIISGSASIHNLRIHADTTAFSDSTSGRPPKTLFRGTIGELNVSGVHILSAIGGNTLHIGSITITNPDLQALRNPAENAQTDSSSHFSSVDSSIYAAIPSRYNRLELGEIKINNAHALFSASGDTLSSINALNLVLRNIQVDSASVQSGRKFITDDISVDGRTFMINLPDSLNKLSLHKFSISSKKHTIILDSLKLIPRYPHFQFSRRNGVQIDRIHLSVPEIKFHDVNFSLFVDSARFHSRFAEINRARMVDFRNKNLPFPPHNHPPLPHTAILNLKQKLKIDSLKVKDSFISYSEYLKSAPRAGKITFEQLNATIKNLTNYTEDINKGHSITMDARTQVMGKGLLSTHFDFPLDTKSGFHKVRGELQRMPFAAFNPMLKYVAFVKADKGTLNSLKFDMTLNNTRSNGTLVMNYENLKVSVLDKKSIKQRGLMENLKTFAANQLIVKKNNTPEGGMRAGQIKFERIHRKSVFNYWWKSLLSGIKGSVTSL